MGTKRYESDLLKLEAEELTELLQSEPILEDLRSEISKQGLIVKEMRLIGFIENGEGLEAGVLMSQGRKCYEFERNVLNGSDFVIWRELSQITDIEDKFPTAVQIYRLLTEAN